MMDTIVVFDPAPGPSVSSTIELPFAPTVAEDGSNNTISVSLGTTQAGDEIILAFIARSPGTITWPSDFTAITNGSGTGGTTTGKVYTARYDQVGTRPSGGTLTVTCSTADALILYCFVVRNSTNTIVAANAGSSGSGSATVGPITANGGGLLIQIWGAPTDKALSITDPGTPPTVGPGSYPATEGYFGQDSVTDTGSDVVVQDNTDYSAGSVSGGASWSGFSNYNAVLIEVT